MEGLEPPLCSLRRRVPYPARRHGQSIGTRGENRTPNILVRSQVPLSIELRGQVVIPGRFELHVTGLKGRCPDR
jgi:hypothetical protein